MFICLGTIQSQEDIHSVDFENINADEWELEQYELDTTAEALICFDVAEIKYEPHIESTILHRKQRIKVLNNAGTKFGEIELTLSRGQRVLKFEAVCSNKNNDVVESYPIDIKDAFVHSPSTSLTIYKFALPNVKPGSIIQFQYKLLIPGMHKVPKWYFQADIPTRYSSYTIHMIPFYEFTFHLQASDQECIQSTNEADTTRRFGTLVYREKVTKFQMENIPSLKQTDHRNERMKISFQLSGYLRRPGEMVEVLSTWQQLNDRLLKIESFGKYINRSEKMAGRLLKEINLAEQESPRSKSLTLIEHLRAFSKFNESYSPLASITPKEFLKERSGNSADINLFLVGLLRSAGLRADPVILSTYWNGEVNKDFPFYGYFNHVVVLVDHGEQSFLADATDIHAAYDRLGLTAINENGLKIYDGKPVWVDLNAKHTSSLSHRIEVDVTPDQDQVKATIISHSSDLEAYQLRKIFENDSSLIRKYYENSGFNMIEDLRTSQYDNVTSPYTIACKGILNFDKIGKLIFLNPFSISPTGVVSQSSESDIWINRFPRSEKFDLSIHKPEKLEIINLPQDTLISNETFEWQITCNEALEEVRLQVRCQIKTTGALESNRQEQLLKLIAVLEEEIVFQPKE